MPSLALGGNCQRVAMPQDLIRWISGSVAAWQSREFVFHGRSSQAWPGKWCCACHQYAHACSALEYQLHLELSSTAKLVICLGRTMMRLGTTLYSSPALPPPPPVQPSSPSGEQRRPVRDVITLSETQRGKGKKQVKDQA